MPRPLFTVVVPSYQQAAFLPRTLDSILHQGVNVEILVQDGGSTDGSVDILRGYGDRVRWTSGPDGGQAAAINTGLHQATGEFLCYLNSDDFFFPEALKKVAAVFTQRPDIKVVYGQVDHVDEQDRFIEAYETQAWDYPQLLQVCYISQPGCFWRREVMDRFGFFDARLRFALDYDYWLRVGKEIPFYYLPEKLAATRLHAEAKTVSLRPRMHEEILRVICRHTAGRPSLHWQLALAQVRAEKHLLEPGCSRRKKRAFVWSYWKEGWKIVSHFEEKWRRRLKVFTKTNFVHRRACHDVALLTGKL
jgi:glycosyltransferase involved in cell wall biosynthesis